MTRIRRLAAAGAIAGTLLLPFGFTSPQPAVAYCDPGPTSESGGGCTNSCKETGKALTNVTDRLGLNLEWNCPQ